MAKDSWTLMLEALSSFFGLAGAENPPLEEKAGAQHETEIIPGTAVVDLVDIDVPAEQGNDESDGRDESMPQPEPETRYLSLRTRGLLDTVGTGSAARKRQK
jgi:hypothetical protein